MRQRSKWFIGIFVVLSVFMLFWFMSSESEMLASPNRITVGIRVPDNPICLAIVQELGHPVINTTASDPETNTILESPQEIRDKIGHALEMIIDGGVVPSRPSSVISLIDDTPEVLREGSGDVKTL